eukprot:m.106978 g.106978  ORF g.106978 m.106978 type:complete len:246 (+) comp13906_c0_seq3:2306-3043(+)
MKSPKKEKATTAKQENSPRFPVLPLSTHGVSSASNTSVRQWGSPKGSKASTANEKGLLTPNYPGSKSATSSPRSTGKRTGKKKLSRADLVPERPRGNHIITLFHKDLNLLHVKEDGTLYDASRLWMMNDPTNEPQTRRSVRGALAGFSLPPPDTKIPAWEPPTKNNSNFEQTSASVDNYINTDADIWALKQQHIAKWKEQKKRSLEASNKWNAKRYAKSLRIIHNDEVKILTDEAAPDTTAKGKN